METYDWDWVQTQVAQTAAVWRDNSGKLPTSGRSYRVEEQQASEDAYDEALKEVEANLRTGAEDRILAAFSRFSAKALGLNPEATELLTQGFMPVGTSLARWARRFDPELSMPGIIQAARNAWTACGLQPLCGVPLGLTPSILGYSLLYPYSDNLLDDEQLPADTKVRFSQRFRRKLLGEDLPPRNHSERCLWALIALIETQYPRSLYPNVYQSMLAIHRAQEASIHQCSNAECLEISCAKGGSSVLADACLAYGSLTNQESQFAFEWGVLLQLGDDLQDVKEDLRRGSGTLFSGAVTEGRTLDAVTMQLLRFSEHVERRMEAMPEGSRVFKDLLKMSWRSLIIGAVADSHEFFSPAFVRQAEQFSPFRFDFLRTRKERIASRQGLNTKLFTALLDSTVVETQPDPPWGRLVTCAS